LKLLIALSSVPRRQHLEGVQLHPVELKPIIKAITSRPQCSLLVFGCGTDSVLWQKINRNGTTAFIEDDPNWLELAQSRLTTAQAYLVSYDTQRSDWQSLVLVATTQKDGFATCNVRGLTFMNWPARGS
jgi:hypothetical protein